MSIVYGILALVVVYYFIVGFIFIIPTGNTISTDNSTNNVTNIDNFGHTNNPIVEYDNESLFNIHDDSQLEMVNFSQKNQNNDIIFEKKNISSLIEVDVEDANDVEVELKSNNHDDEKLDNEKTDESSFFFSDVVEPDDEKSGDHMISVMNKLSNEVDDEIEELWPIQIKNEYNTENFIKMASEVMDMDKKEVFDMDLELDTLIVSDSDLIYGYDSSVELYI